MMIQYAPTAETEVVENPPRFTWLPVIDDEARYVLRISTDQTFPQKGTLVFEDLALNFFTPDTVLEPGEYHWSYATWDNGKPASTWGETRSFSVAASLPETPLPSRKDRLANSTRAHPRLWMTPDHLADFKEAVKADPTHCTWSTFYEKSVLPWMDKEITKETPGYPNHKRVASVWRATYIELQEVWYAIRHIAIGGAVTGDAAMTARAKEWLLPVASWDPMGTTSRPYTEEWAHRG